VTVPLPSNLSYTKLTGRFIKAVLDGSDADAVPDSVPFTGLTIVIAADLNPRRARVAGSTPPVTVDLTPFTVTTDADGDVAMPDGTKGVYIVSSNDPDLSPSGWTYSATITGTGYSPDKVTFIAPSGGTIDLASLTRVPANPGAELTAWNAAVTRAEAAAARAEAAAGAGGGSVTLETLNQAIATHRASASPHPAYDNIPSLTLLFENGLI
jgi:hypothetical protein